MRSGVEGEALGADLGAPGPAAGGGRALGRVGSGAGEGRTLPESEEATADLETQYIFLAHIEKSLSDQQKLVFKK